MKILNIVKTLYLKFLIYQSNQYSVAKVYRKYFGVKIGRNVRFTGKQNWSTEVYLIEIGDNVIITQNVIFHTHDGGVGIFRNEYPGINIFGKIKIGNNVFIGSHTIFLPGITVGNNVVVGAGSIVTKDVPSNVVVAGAPARVLKTIKEYKKTALKKALFIDEVDLNKREEIIIQSLKI